MQKTDHSNSHIVTTNTSRVTVRSQAVVHHVLADELQGLLSHNSSPHELNDSLRRLTIPDTYTNWLAQVRVVRADKELTITCNHQELVILVDVVYLDVREGGDYLLLGREVGALLEFKVTYRTRQGKVAVDAAKVDETASCLDARFLGWQLLA
jgi:hypothetical protein